MLLCCCRLDFSSHRKERNNKATTGQPVKESGVSNLSVLVYQWQFKNFTTDQKFTLFSLSTLFSLIHEFMLLPPPSFTATAAKRKKTEAATVNEHSLLLLNLEFMMV